MRPCDPETRKIKPSVRIKHGRECLTVSRFKAALFRRALRSASLGSALSRLPDSRTIFAGCEHVELTAFFFFFPPLFLSLPLFPPDIFHIPLFIPCTCLFIRIYFGLMHFMSYDDPGPVLHPQSYPAGK